MYHLNPEKPLELLSTHQDNLWESARHVTKENVLRFKPLWGPFVRFHGDRTLSVNHLNLGGIILSRHHWIPHPVPLTGLQPADKKGRSFMFHTSDRHHTLTLAEYDEKQNVTLLYLDTLTRSGRSDVPADFKDSITKRFGEAPQGIQCWAPQRRVDEWSSGYLCLALAHDWLDGATKEKLRANEYKARLLRFTILKWFLTGEASSVPTCSTCTPGGPMVHLLGVKWSEKKNCAIIKYSEDSVVHTEAEKKMDQELKDKVYEAWKRFTACLPEKCRVLVVKDGRFTQQPGKRSAYIKVNPPPAFDEGVESWFDYRWRIFVVPTAHFFPNEGPVDVRMAFLLAWLINTSQETIRVAVGVQSKDGLLARTWPQWKGPIVAWLYDQHHWVAAAVPKASDFAMIFDSRVSLGRSGKFWLNVQVTDARLRGFCHLLGKNPLAYKVLVHVYKIS